VIAAQLFSSEIFLYQYDRIGNRPNAGWFSSERPSMIGAAASLKKEKGGRLPRFGEALGRLRRGLERGAKNVRGRGTTALINKGRTLLAR
jgi:hypothetical protein